MQEKKDDSVDIKVRQEGDKFYIIDTVKTTIPKKQKLNHITLAGNEPLGAVEGMLTATQEQKIIDKGGEYDVTVTTTTKVNYMYFLRIVGSVRMMRDKYKPQIKALGLIQKDLDMYDPFVKNATLIRKRVEAEMKRGGKRTNKDMR